MFQSDPQDIFLNYKYIVIYDGSCAFCCWWKNWLDAKMTARAIRTMFIDYHRLPDDFCGIKKAEMEEKLFCIDRSHKAYAGAYAVLKLLSENWFYGTLFVLYESYPLVKKWFDKGYAWVARRRK